MKGTYNVVICGNHVEIESSCTVSVRWSEALTPVV